MGIGEIQIKHARTLPVREGVEQATMSMTEDLRLPRESGIKKTLQERLITAAHTGSYLRERAHAHI